jgi:hypothetical protein
MDNSITVQFSRGGATITAQLEGVKYSPDVFNDILVQGTRALGRVMTGDEDEVEQYQILTLDELMNQIKDDD